MHDTVLQGLESFTDAYIDDIEVDTMTTFLQHLLHLREVCNRLRWAKLHAKPSKCTIAGSVVNFVDHRVGRDMTKPCDALIESIKNFPKPGTRSKFEHV